MKGILILCGVALPNHPFASHCEDGTTIRSKTDSIGRLFAPCPWVTFRYSGVVLASKIEKGRAEARCDEFIVRRK
jgi:hypothetical protein